MDKNYILKLTIGLYKVTDLFPRNEPLMLKMRERADDIYAKIIASDFCNGAFDCEPLVNDLNVLSAYLDLAKVNNWVDHRNFNVLTQGYAETKDFVLQKLIEDNNTGHEMSRDRSAMSSKGNVRNVSHVPNVSRVTNVSRVRNVSHIPQGEAKLKHNFNSATTKPPTKPKVVAKYEDFIQRKADIQKVLSQSGPMRVVQLVKSFPGINVRTLRRDLTNLIDQEVLERYDVGKLTFYKIKSI